jgi:hypothetical protein
VHENLRRQVAIVAAERDSFGELPRDLDSGVLRLAVQEDDATWDLAWGPHDAPGVLRDLENELRQGIAQLRANAPAATLHAALAVDGDRLALVLRNTGTTEFKGRVLEARLRDEEAPPDGAPRPGDPVDLLGSASVVLELEGAPPGLGPGETVALRLDSPAPASGRLTRTLVSSRWTAARPGGPEIEAEGWLLPAPVSG